eukprot:TRINITY_DN1534_c0_g1_i17.p1 TRINITY_DN1534_c0_g1~~TRINITY_DN1534_c0_g1_i17.p1  ORF type:complete len:101 (+),score=5.20 TRINITY_DN1534_c0_g1_i17:940-1242(+)
MLFPQLLISVDSLISLYFCLEPSSSNDFAPIACTTCTSKAAYPPVGCKQHHDRGKTPRLLQPVFDRVTLVIPTSGFHPLALHGKKAEESNINNHQISFSA